MLKTILAVLIASISINLEAHTNSNESASKSSRPFQYELTAQVYADDVLQSSPRIITMNNTEASIEQSLLRKIAECSERQQEKFKGQKYCDESMKLKGLISGHKNKEKVNITLQFLVDNFEDEIDISFKAQSFLKRKTILNFTSPDSGKEYRLELSVDQI